MPSILLMVVGRVTVTVWRLIDPAGIEIRCLLENVGVDRWDLRLDRAGEVIRAEEHPTADAAFARANAIWLDCLLDGWTEP